MKDFFRFDKRRGLVNRSYGKQGCVVIPGIFWLSMHGTKDVKKKR